MPEQPFTLSIPPGVLTDNTRYSDSRSYTDSDRIRFRLGKPESIGGWEAISGISMFGITRTIFPFADLAGNRSIFFGTNPKAYVWNNSTSLFDITPVYSSGAYPNSISTSIGLSRVGVTLAPGDPKAVGNFIIIAGAVLTGGIPAVQLNAEHRIAEVIGNTVYFDVVAVASGTVPAGGGAGVTVTILWPTGAQDNLSAGSWGSGGWGSGGWGGGSSIVQVPIRFWSVDAWGEDLLISPSDGPIFYWDKTSPSNRALPISGMVGASEVPVAARQIMVTDQNRIVVAFATNPIGSSTQDPMLIRWSDNENYLEWDPAVAGSAAGELRLTSGSVFVAALEAPNEVLIWSDTTLFGLSPSGDNSIFSLRVLSPRASIFGPRAMAIAGDAIFWWGPIGFYRYAGSVQRLACPVEDYITALLDTSRLSKTYCGAISEFNEVIWFFRSSDAPTLEPNMYIKFNYVDNVWDFGFMQRTAWHDSDIFSKPIATTSTGTFGDSSAYYHESGFSYTDVTTYSERPSSITIGNTRIDQIGGSFIACRWLIPDIEFRTGVTSGTVRVLPSYSRGPGRPMTDGPEMVVQGFYTGDPELTQQSRYRMRGRGQAVEIVFTADHPTPWRMGEITIMGLKDGRK